MATISIEDALKEIIRRIQPPAVVAHFTSCPFRFRGEYSREVTKHFLWCIDYYKTAQGITDENALYELPYLLEGPARTWWTSVKGNATTWAEAVELIREEFGPTLPAYQVYLEIFKTKQEPDVPIGLFIALKMALFSQLETQLEEATQIDMIYGLLLPIFREKIPRDSVQTLMELMTRGRHVYHPVEDKESQSLEDMRKRKNRRKRRRRKKIATKIAEESSQDVQGNTIPACQHPGAARSNCTNPTTTRYKFFDTRAPARPAVDIWIGDRPAGIAYLATGSKNCIASPSLVKLLRQNSSSVDVFFSRHTMDITLADGSTAIKSVETIHCTVTLQHKKVHTTFFVLPDEPKALTLLGIDFITKTGMVMDFGTGTWWFDDQPGVPRQLSSKDEYELASMVNVDVSAKRVRMGPSETHAGNLGHSKGLERERLAFN